MDNIDVPPVRVFVHPLLVEEFKYLQLVIEKEQGYKIQGGMPIVSLIVALRLKQKRLDNRKVLNGNTNKVKGEKKINLTLNVNKIANENKIIKDKVDNKIKKEKSVN